MNRQNISQLFKGLLIAKSLFVLGLLTPSIAAAATGTATLDDIKDTNYSIPDNAYFVSPDGKDTNSGIDANSPWSVDKAINSAPAGSTIIFRGGVYRNVDSIIKRKLTLQAYPGEKPMLKGSIEVTGWVADGNMWRKDGWEYSFPQNMGSEFIDPNYPMAGYRDMVFINGVALKQVKTKAEVVPGTFYVDAVNKQLYIGDNPANKTVESTAHDVAFFMWKGGSDPSGTVIRGLGFAHYADRAVSVGAPNVTLENNTFVWNGQQGVVTNGINNDNIIRGNIFSYNGRVGLRASAANRMLLENNTFSYNNVERFSKIWDAAGVKITKTDGLIARNNLFEHNLSNGIWLDISTTNSKVVHNTSRYNEALGIFMEISHKAIIASNLSHNNGTGIMVSNSSSAKIYNNTVANNNRNIWIKDSKRNNTNSSEIAAGITWIARDHVVKNNILSNTNGGPFLEAANCDTREPSKQMIAAADSNAYYRTSSKAPRTIFKWASDSSNCSVGYNSVVAFSSATNFEQRALSIDDVAINPFFVDQANGDYRLKPGSPAIKRGEALPADVASAIGVEPGVSVDLGMLQPTR